MSREKTWESEPDREEFIHVGLECVIVRIKHSGVLNGYVCVLPEHPLHGVGYGQVHPSLLALHQKRMGEPLGDNPSFALTMGVLAGDVEASPDTVLQVHGGITYADAKLNGSDKEDAWWFGFDTAHCDDFCPAMDADKLFNTGVYRDLEYVHRETESLAEQLKSIADESASLSGLT